MYRVLHKAYVVKKIVILKLTDGEFSRNFNEKSFIIDSKLVFFFRDIKFGRQKRQRKWANFKNKYIFTNKMFFN